MNECKDLISLNKITSEVDESHIKIILSSQCIKAQIFLVERLKKELDRQKEVCKTLSSSNVKVDAEIKHAALELKSLMIAVETMQSSNVELKKDLLLTKERLQETSKRCQSGVQKYEQLWQQCKKRYESIPYVQKWFEFTNKTQTLNDRIKFLDQETATLKQEIRSKSALVLDFDKRHIIELSKYLVEERSKLINDIIDKSSQVSKLNKEINILTQEQNAANRCTNKNKESCSIIDADWPNLDDCLNTENDIIEMPALQLGNYDLNIFTVNLEQKKKCSSALITNDVSNNERNIISYTCNLGNENHESSLFARSYFDNGDLSDGSNKNDYSKKRLINIIEDINLDKNEAVHMISKFNSNDMQIVDTIQVNIQKDNQDREENSNTINEIIDLNNQPNQEQDAEIIPPTQFLDHPKSPQGSQKKKVSFELPTIQEIADETIDDIVKMSETVDEDGNATVTSQLDASVVSDESFNKMKEIILKRHRLDLSPDFVYAKKNRETQNNNSDETSKFFKKSDEDCVKSNVNIQNTPATVCKDNNLEVGEEVHDPQTKDEAVETAEENLMEVNTTTEHSLVGPKSVSGFLFTHGPLGIPDSLDVSISTTGYEEGDIDFPQCIDSSLLLSPKADNAMTSGSEAPQVFSQEVPNFLSGLRKGGFSFFGSSSNIDSSPQQGNGDGYDNNFNFNFGGENKKSKGLFSMFK